MNINTVIFFSALSVLQQQVTETGTNYPKKVREAKWTMALIGPFTRGKIRRVLNKTRTGPFIRACLI